MIPLDVARIRRAFPDRHIDYYPSIDSTMHAAAGLAAGSAVIAEEQTAGQGRLGHSWHSEAGAGIYCTVVLQPMPVLTLALGLAVQSAIEQAIGLRCDIRWPNDLMLNGKKVGGILVQVVEGNCGAGLSACPERAGRPASLAIAGIGINVNHTSLPPELEKEATSLRIERGTALSREAILIALLPAVDEFAGQDKDSILRLFARASSYVSGRRVVARQGDALIEGVTAGLDASGFLIVRKDDGTEALILAGGVRAAGS